MAEAAPLEVRWRTAGVAQPTREEVAALIRDLGWDRPDDVGTPGATGEEVVEG